MLHWESFLWDCFTFLHMERTIYPCNAQVFSSYHHNIIILLFWRIGGYNFFFFFSWMHFMKSIYIPLACGYSLKALFNFFMSQLRERDRNSLTIGFIYHNSDPFFLRKMSWKLFVNLYLTILTSFHNFKIS